MLCSLVCWQARVCLASWLVLWKWPRSSSTSAVACSQLIFLYRRNLCCVPFVRGRPLVTGITVGLDVAALVVVVGSCMFTASFAGTDAICCVPFDCGRPLVFGITVGMEVAALVVDIGSCMLKLVLLVKMHFVLCSFDWRQAQVPRHVMGVKGPPTASKCWLSRARCGGDAGSQTPRRSVTLIWCMHAMSKEQTHVNSSRSAPPTTTTRRQFCPRLPGSFRGDQCKHAGVWINTHIRDRTSEPPPPP